MQLQFLAQSTPLGLALQQHLDGTGEAVDLQANPRQDGQALPAPALHLVFLIRTPAMARADNSGRAAHALLCRVVHMLTFPYLAGSIWHRSVGQVWPSC